MSFEDLLTKTMTDPDLFWSAAGVVLQLIQTLFVLISGVVVILQIRQIRRDSIEKKIIGLKTAVEALDTEHFRLVSKQAMEGRTIQGAQWRRLLDSINFVALTIEEGFTNEKLLLALKGKELYSISAYIQANDPLGDLKSELDDQFKPAINFLNRVNKQAKKLGYID